MMERWNNGESGRRRLDAGTWIIDARQDSEKKRNKKSEATPHHENTKEGKHEKREGEPHGQASARGG